ncbi:mechanosensitive ion channel family protein [bacterium]|nr:MAG: mechanosensitive ion channel family protein [bacterium]
MGNISSQTILNNTSNLYAWAVIIFIVTFIALKIFKGFIVSYLKKISEKTKTTADDVAVKILQRIGTPFYIVVSLYLAIQPLELPEYIAQAVYYALIFLGTYEVVKAVQTLIDYIIERTLQKEGVKERESVGVIKMFGQIAKISVWIGATILVLSNFGFDVTSLIAGLGISGIAIALALQNILGDLFSSLAIFIDKPFKVGDFIIAGSEMGTVQKIGIKSTRIIALRGEEIIISNQDLTNARVLNFKKMEKRRIDFGIGVEYGTDAEKLKKIPQIIKDIIKDIELTDFDRAHFHEFGDFSLNFEIVYYVLTNDYNKYMDIQQEINLKIVDVFKKEKIEIAFPTQTVYVTNKH